MGRRLRGLAGRGRPQLGSARATPITSPSHAVSASVELSWWTPLPWRRVDPRCSDAGCAGRGAPSIATVRDLGGGRLRRHPGPASERTPLGKHVTRDAARHLALIGERLTDAVSGRFDEPVDQIEAAAS